MKEVIHNIIHIIHSFSIVLLSFRPTTMSQTPWSGEQCYDWDPKNPFSFNHPGPKAGFSWFHWFVQLIFEYAKPFFNELVRKVIGTTETSWIIWYKDWVVAYPAAVLLATTLLAIAVLRLLVMTRKAFRSEYYGRGFPFVVRVYLYIEQIAYLAIVVLALVNNTMGSVCLAVVFTVMVVSTGRLTSWSIVNFGDPIDLDEIVNEAAGVTSDSSPVANQVLVGEYNDKKFSLAGQGMFYRKYGSWNLFIVPTHVVDAIETKDMYVTNSRVYEKVVPMRFGETIGIPFPTKLPDFTVLCSPVGITNLTQGMKTLAVGAVALGATANVSCHLMGMDGKEWRQKSVGRMKPSVYSPYVYQYDGDTAPGWSGAPVTLLGKVIGMHTTAVKNSKLSATNGGYLLDPILNLLETLYLGNDAWGIDASCVSPGIVRLPLDEAKGKNKGRSGKMKGSKTGRYKGGAYSTPRIYQDIREGKVWAVFDNIQISDTLEEYWVFTDSRGRTYIRSYDEIPEDIIDLMKNPRRERLTDSKQSLPMIDTTTFLAALGAIKLEPECADDEECDCGATDAKVSPEKKTRAERPITPIDHDRWERCLRLMQFFGEIGSRCAAMARLTQIALVRRRDNIPICKQLIANMMTINNFIEQLAVYGKEFSDCVEEQAIMTSGELTDKNRAARHRAKLPDPPADPVILQELAEMQGNLDRLKAEFDRMPARIYPVNGGDDDDVEVLQENLSPAFAQHMKEAYSTDNKGFTIGDLPIVDSESKKKQVFQHGGPSSGKAPASIKKESLKTPTGHTENSQETPSLMQLHNQLKTLGESLKKNMEVLHFPTTTQQKTSSPMKATKTLQGEGKQSLKRSKSMIKLEDECYLTHRQRKSALEPSIELANHLDKSRHAFKQRELTKSGWSYLP
nr:MAG: protease 3C [Chemarfal virus 51]